MAAKASWGYSPAWLDGWRDQILLTPAQLQTWVVTVALAGPEILGFSALIPGQDVATLEHLWVTPPAMGRGVGRALLRHARVTAARLGAQALLIESDPNAEAFYLRSGAERIGTRAAPLPDNPARVLPQLRLATGDG
jgi:GNAT superfamily N-acetyltransferase